MINIFILIQSNPQDRIFTINELFILLLFLVIQFIWVGLLVSSYHIQSGIVISYHSCLAPNVVILYHRNFNYGNFVLCSKKSFRVIAKCIFVPSFHTFWGVGIVVYLYTFY